MKKIIGMCIFLISSINLSFGQTDENVEFSLDRGEKIQAEDPSKMESIDSTNFDQAFEDPKKKRRLRKTRKVSKGKKKRPKSKVKSKADAPHEARVSSTVKNAKSKEKQEGTNTKTSGNKVNRAGKESYFDRVVKIVKVEYKKAKSKAESWAKELKKKWDSYK